MARRHIDWDSIEREYRAGQLSTREIAREHDVSDAAVRKKAKALGWERDLSQEVKTRVKAKVARQEVLDSDEDEAIVEKAAQRGADVIALHKTSIGTGRQLVDGMLRELLSQHTNRDLLKELIEQHGDDLGEKMTAVVQKAISLSSRATTARDLSQAMERLIRLERQAFSLDEQSTGESYEDQLKRLMG